MTTPRKAWCCEIVLRWSPAVLAAVPHPISGRARRAANRAIRASARAVARGARSGALTAIGYSRGLPDGLAGSVIDDEAIPPHDDPGPAVRVQEGEPVGVEQAAVPRSAWCPTARAPCSTATTSCPKRTFARRCSRPRPTSSASLQGGLWSRSSRCRERKGPGRTEQNAHMSRTRR
jgi:hypothetical protein